MIIEQYDHILRFRFTSQNRPEISHIVDLGEFDGFGECSCEDFQYRIAPALTKGERPAARCKHLIAAREHLLNLVINRVSNS